MLIFGNYGDHGRQHVSAGNVPPIHQIARAVSAEVCCGGFLLRVLWQSIK